MIPKRELGIQPRAGVVSGMPLELRALAYGIHDDNIRAGWWQQVVRDTIRVTVPRNIGELLCLVHSEISEAEEGLRGNLFDDKLPHRKMFEVELADVAIRVLDILGYYQPAFNLSLKVGVNEVEFPHVTQLHDLLLAMHSTVSASMEHFRKKRIEEGCERLWVLLHLLDWAALSEGLDLTGAIAEKRAFNAQRADHKPENRAKAGGKAF